MSREPIVLRVDGLGVRVGERWLVREVTFEARGGEIVAVVGPNGAGKTTLLEAVAGLRRLSAGAVRTGQQPLLSFREHARTFAYLPDDTEAAYELTAGNCVSQTLACRPRGEALLA